MCVYVCVCVHAMVSSDGKVPIKVWINFLWFIVEHYWKAEAYFIQLKCIIIK